jgi:enoyl-CoA hydratase/carnithine racemase
VTGITSNTVYAEPVSAGVAAIVLGRAGARNAIDPEWVAGLARAVDAVADAAAARCVLIRADGPAFTVGGDLDHFAGRLDDLGPELDRMTSQYHRTLAQLASLPVPVVCAVRGAAAGGGLGLLWAADAVVVATGAKLAAGFPRLGLSGDGGSSWYLPRIVGLRRATQLLMHGRVLSGAEAVEWGLADRAVEDEAVEDVALEWARRLAAGPTFTYGAMRASLRQAFGRSLTEGLDAERAALAACGAGPDGREGVAAFVERRAPQFRGR